GALADGGRANDVPAAASKRQLATVRDAVTCFMRSSLWFPLEKRTLCYDCGASLLDAGSIPAQRQEARLRTKPLLKPSFKCLHRLPHRCRDLVRQYGMSNAG